MIMSKRARTDSTADLISHVFAGDVPPEIQEDLYKASAAKEELTKETYNAIKQLLKETFSKEEDAVSKLQELLEEREKASIAQIKEYKAERDTFKARIVELEEQLKKQDDRASRKSTIKPPDESANAAELTKRVEQLSAEKKELEAIYATEVQHSKELKDELKVVKASLGSSVASSAAAAPSDFESSSNESLTFTQDLTNLVIHSVKKTDQATLYNCVLHRFEPVQGGSLSFKLSVSAPSGDITYIPKLEPSDTLLKDLLPSKMQKEITFGSELAPVFFKNLFFALNSDEE